jgi:hypothetical protein
MCRFLANTCKIQGTEDADGRMAVDTIIMLWLPYGHMGIGREDACAQWRSLRENTWGGQNKKYEYLGRGGGKRPKQFFYAVTKTW